MTATIKPPDRGSAPRRPIRFSSMESLGFSDATSTWSDPPAGTLESEDAHPGRHIGLVPDDTVADWTPQEFGDRLDGGNVRWGMVTVIAIVLTAVAGLGYWLYQRPEAERAASIVEVSTGATSLEAAIADLERFTDDLLEPNIQTGSDQLFGVENEARTLFEASGKLGNSESSMRTASADAASSALDGIRLATETHAYRTAILPVLSAPALETDPTLVELDEAARSFGDWQLVFDDVRTALPDSVLPDVTHDLDVLSGDLNSIMGRYLDALRADNGSAAAGVLSDLELRLGKIEDTLTVSIEDIQARIEARIAETKSALGAFHDG